MPRLELWKGCVTRVLEVSTILSPSIRLWTELLLSDLSFFSFGTLLYRSGIVVNNTSLNPYTDNGAGDLERILMFRLKRV
jgi:hypothetical protein